MKTDRNRWLSMPLLAAALLIVGTPAEGQTLDASAREAVRAELDAFFDQYYAWYSVGAADEVSRHAYNVPFFRGGSALGTQEEVRQSVADAYARLDAQGYAGSGHARPQHLRPQRQRGDRQRPGHSPSPGGRSAWASTAGPTRS